MKSILVFSLLCCSLVFGQADFNNYTTLRSNGAIPDDFTTLTYNKLEQDLAEGDRSLTRQEEKVFFEGINYAIDDLLHSGLVTYGDDVSNYLGKIADKLLKGDKELRNKLRFYTLKSNSTNAFSTEQGIVFVTTGLISQVTCEAQIAFILAHEISHYQERHVVESFSYRSSHRRKSIEQMSIYSKDKEFEADKLGLRMYHAAGYTIDEVIPTFDVLMYSYLPFDEIEIPLSYFQNQDSLYLPEYLHPEKRFEIKAIEDTDDSRSSHPNIKKRKEAINEEFKTLSNWGTTVNSLGEEKFEYIRNIARFESVRNDVIDAKYGDALYSIYLLERDFDESIYLERMKAQAWLGLIQYRLENKISRTIDRKSEYEGSSASVHFMIRKLSKDQLEAFAIRQIFDLYKGRPNDEELGLIWNKTVKSIVYGDNFELTEFSTKNFSEAAREFELNQNNLGDSTAQDSLEVDKKQSKYDRIKSKRDVDNVVENFDSTEFHIYLLPDVINDPTFTSPYWRYSKQMDSIQEVEEAYKSLSYREQIKHDRDLEKDRLKLGINEMIVVEPTVFSYKGGRVNRVKSEKLEQSFSEVIDETSEIAGIHTYPINSSILDKQGTQGYNERSTLINMISQLATEDDIDPFPVDYQLLKEIQENYGTSNVMFSIVENSYSPNINASIALTSIIFYPIGLIYIPISIFSGNNTEIDMIILDINEASVVAATSRYVKDNARKHTIGAHVYSIFSQLNAVK